MIDIGRAQELDPLSLIINACAGRPYYYAGKDDKAIEQFQKTLEMDSNFRPAHRYLVDAYIKTGRYTEALSEAEIFNDLPRIGLTYALMGKTAEANQVLKQLIEKSKRMYVSKSRIANIYFALGDNDQGFVWLQRAFEERDFSLTMIKVNPFFNSVRSDPRFKLLLKNMNL